jgi:hypothetical protein
MIGVMERSFSDRYQSWLPKLNEMGTELSSGPATVGAE